MMMNDDQILADFVTESRDHLAGIENQLLAIESSGAQPDSDLVNTVFRAVHSIKGAAGFLGLTAIGHLSHGLESVLNLVRNGQWAPDAGGIDVLLRGADKLRGMIEDVEHSNEVDVVEHLDALKAIVAGAMASPETLNVAAAAPSAVPPAVEPVSLATEPASAAAPPAPAAPQAIPEPSDHDGHPLADSAQVQSSAARPANAPAASDSSIRVNVGVLDRLMNLAGELVLARNQLLQMVNATEHRALTSVGARLNQVTSELQETIMQTRLQTVATVFNRFPRVVRDLSIAMGKQCQLTVEGQEVEVDKSILEAISDPLTHLVRNAIDHGLESPEARFKAGKSPTGTVSLRAFHQAGKVNIVVADDGRGIDVNRVKEKAIARGLIHPEQARTMTHREALQLIFRPGLSTADQVTQVSGRGVGMDVVKTNVERLGGTVSVETELGKGTKVHVKLPLTLAIIPSLIVRCRGRRYAIPQGSIRELVRIKGSEVAKKIERVKRAEVFRLRGALLPLVHLSDVLGLPRVAGAEECPALSIIVVESGHLRYGLVVDGLCDSEEIVVKPLGRHMKSCVCLAGATILGDGQVALILDISGIASHSQLASGEQDGATDSAGGDSTEETQSVLLFSNHPTEFFGIPMELVARLERVRTDQIEQVGGQQVLQYRGGSLPLLTLENHVACQPRLEATKAYVVVFTAARREIGLLVPELLDIRSVPTQVDTDTFREPGILGSLVFERRTIRLVDVHELARKAHPDWFHAAPAQRRDDGDMPRILLAEDSDFFRKQLSGFLEAEGYEVRACEDGAVAWEAIREPGSHFDLLITDIEMPNMTGLELARHVRDYAAAASLPIIAVSSLAGEDDIRRGREVGVTEYHVKLDRERLVESVARVLQSTASKVLQGSYA
jgi:two-component system chemotaxis sensor kinase CheA